MKQLFETARMSLALGVLLAASLGTACSDGGGGTGAGGTTTNSGDSGGATSTTTTTGCSATTELCGGVCVDVAKDPENCGKCGSVCEAGEVCSNGGCALSCGGGATQCEQSCVDTRLDPQHCGDCTTACAAGEVCSRGTCGLECTGGTLECDALCVDSLVDSKHCGDCTTACAAGEICASGLCALECTGGTSKCDASCFDLSLDAQHCGDCATVCAAGEVCSGGVCGLECTGGTLECDAACVDSQLDAQHCGDCATACAAGEVCSQGACALDCTGGTTKCGSVCADTALDPANCGSCGAVCAAGEVCSQGACALACTGGTTKCGSVCSDTALDPANCGGCGLACAAGEVCSQGACAASCGALAQCGAVCVDTTNNAQNCGACGTACTASQVCSGSVCACLAGQTACGNACANLSSSSLHCGACGSACAAGQVCSSGACAALVLGNGSTGGGLSGANPPKVAVYGAYTSLDLQTKLVATGAFSAVDFVNINTTTPTVAQMSAYDAIVVYTYFSVPSTTIGDNLATYREAGGGVVMTTYESAETGSYILKGRYLTDYGLMTPTSSAGYPTGTFPLGTINEPASPLLTGVTTFTSKVHGLTANLKPGTIVVASYADGNPAIMRNVINGQPIVELNAFGLSTVGLSSYGWDPATDGAKLFRNALIFSIPLPTLTTVKEIAFMDQTLYTASAVQTITYTNVTAATQTLTALKLTGPHIGDFEVTPAAALPATVMPGATFTLNVVFKPSGLGLRAVTLGATIQGTPKQLTTLLRGSGI